MTLDVVGATVTFLIDPGLLVQPFSGPTHYPSNLLTGVDVQSSYGPFTPLLPCSLESTLLTHSFLVFLTCPTLC